MRLFLVVQLCLSSNCGCLWDPVRVERSLRALLACNEKSRLFLKHGCWLVLRVERHACVQKPLLSGQGGQSAFFLHRESHDGESLRLAV